MFTIFDILQHLANSLEALASVFNDMLYLRLFLAIGMSMELFYDFNISDKPLWTNVIWTVVIVGINVVQIVMIIKERGSLKFNPDEVKIYHTVFSSMHKVEFKKLIRTGKWETVPTGTTLITEGTKIENLTLIFEGMAEVRVKGKIVAILRDGQFMGEMSFLSGKPTTATVTSLTELKYISWPVCTLNDLIKKVPEVGSGLNNIFNSDLIQKIVIKNEE